MLSLIVSCPIITISWFTWEMKPCLMPWNPSHSPTQKQLISGLIGLGYYFRGGFKVCTLTEAIILRLWTALAPDCSSPISGNYSFFKVIKNCPLLNKELMQTINYLYDIDVYNCQYLTINWKNIFKISVSPSLQGLTRNWISFAMP